MSPEEQAEWRPVLVAREAELRGKLASNEELTRPPSLDEEIGRLTRQDALQQQQMALHARRRLQLQLEMLRGAFTRLDEGTFGTCPVCNEDVAPARLELAPETPFCIDCQTRLERERHR